MYGNSVKKYHHILLKTSLVVFLVAAYAGEDLAAQKLGKLPKPTPTQWSEVDDNGDTVTGKVWLELNGPVVNGGNKYSLIIYFPVVQKSNSSTPSMYFSGILPSSISLAIDDTKAHFNANSQTLKYMAEDMIEYVEYQPPQPPDERLQALVNVGLGAVGGMAIEVADTIMSLDAFFQDKNETVTYSSATYNWAESSVVRYGDYEADPVFNDIENDIQTIAWNELDKNEGWQGHIESLRYEFEIVRDDPSPTPLYIRVVLGYIFNDKYDQDSLLSTFIDLLKEDINLRFVEIEWKADLPGIAPEPDPQPEPDQETTCSLCAPLIAFAKVKSDSSTKRHQQKVVVPEGTTGLELEWADRSDDESGFRIRQYVWQGLTLQPTEIGTVDANQTSFTVTGQTFETGEDYTFDVCAYNADTPDGDPGVCSNPIWFEVEDSSNSDCPECPKLDCSQCPVDCSRCPCPECICSEDEPLPTGTLFFNDFSDTSLSQWVGKNGGKHSGQVVSDPLNSANKVLRFKKNVGAGDLFSDPIKVNPAKEYGIYFDYLGSPASTARNGNGGAIGIATGTPGSHRWLAGTSTSGGIEKDILEDDGRWHSYRVKFKPIIQGSSVSSFRIMLEEFQKPAGDAYFDNIKVVSVGD
jgi:hypothetical protein